MISNFHGIIFEYHEFLFQFWKGICLSSRNISDNLVRDGFRPLITTTPENKHLCYCDYFAIIPTWLFKCCYVGELRCNWTEGAPLKYKQKIKDLSVVWSSCCQNRKCGNFSLLSLCEWRHGIVLKCALHVHHAYFSSFNQSNSSFEALSLPLTSSIIKLSNASSTVKTAIVIFLPQLFPNQIFAAEQASSNINRI